MTTAITSSSQNDVGSRACYCLVLEKSRSHSRPRLSLTNSRGSRVQSRGRGSNVAVSGPMSRSRVQSRGRGSNVAAGENDLEFEVTE